MGSVAWLLAENEVDWQVAPAFEERPLTTAAFDAAVGAPPQPPPPQAVSAAELERLVRQHLQDRLSERANLRKGVQLLHKQGQAEGDESCGLVLRAMWAVPLVLALDVIRATSRRISACCAVGPRRAEPPERVWVAAEDEPAAHGPGWHEASSCWDGRPGDCDLSMPVARIREQIWIATAMGSTPSPPVSPHRGGLRPAAAGHGNARLRPASTSPDGSTASPASFSPEPVRTGVERRPSPNSQPPDPERRASRTSQAGSRGPDPERRASRQSGVERRTSRHSDMDRKSVGERRLSRHSGGTDAERRASRHSQIPIQPEDLEHALELEVPLAMERQRKEEKRRSVQGEGSHSIRLSLTAFLPRARAVSASMSRTASSPKGSAQEEDEEADDGTAQAPAGDGTGSVNMAMTTTGSGQAPAEEAARPSQDASRAGAPRAASSGARRVRPPGQSRSVVSGAPVQSNIASILHGYKGAGAGAQAPHAEGGGASAGMMAPTSSKDSPAPPAPGAAAAAAARGPTRKSGEARSVLSNFQSNSAASSVLGAAMARQPKARTHRTRADAQSAVG